MFSLFRPILTLLIHKQRYTILPNQFGLNFEREKMKKPVCLLLSVLIFFAGCAGREANPIPAYLPGDNTRSCAALTAEMAQLQADMQRLLPKTNKALTNALWATAGVFFIVPFFFMDLKGAEKIEFDAMRQRHNRLLIIAADKNCDVTGVRAERIPSIKERKEAAKKAKKEAAEIKREIKKNLKAQRKIEAKLKALETKQVTVTDDKIEAEIKELEFKKEELEDKEKELEERQEELEQDSSLEQ